MNIAISTRTLVCLMLMAGCRQPPDRAEASKAGDTGTRFTVTTVASGLEVPWAIAFAPDKLIFITERPGRIQILRDGIRSASPILIKDVEETGESGLMDLTLHPEYSENRLVYISYVYRTRQGLRLRIARHRFTGTSLEAEKVIIEDIPAARYHAGCRMGFGPDGKLYITTGDAGEGKLSQKLDSLAGKTLRLNEDGSIPHDNPLTGRPGARPEIWSYGHRNAQGIDWHPGTGLQLQSEHGPSGSDGPGGGDEINIIEKGRNYGWPVIHHRQKKEGMEAPLLEYTPAVAPASLRFYKGTLFAQFKNSLLVGCLRGERILRVALDGSGVRREETLLQNQFGRIRAIAVGPDGAIYFSTSNRDGRGSPAPDDDRVIRLTPARQ